MIYHDGDIIQYSTLSTAVYHLKLRDPKAVPQYFDMYPRSKDITSDEPVGSMRGDIPRMNYTIIGNEPFPKFEERDPIEVGLTCFTANTAAEMSDNDDGVCSWGYVTTGVKKVFRYDAGCHYDLRFADSAAVLWNYILDAEYEPVSSEIRRAYISWLSDPQVSPWRSLFQHTEDRIINGVNVDSLEFRDKYGWFFTDLSMPANVLMNFLVATRLIREIPEQVEQWYKYVQQGVHPNVAYWFARALINIDWGLERGKTQIVGVDPGHTCIDIAASSRAHFEGFIRGQMVADKLLKPFKDKAYCTPCNVIWGPGTTTIDEAWYAGEFVESKPTQYGGRVLSYTNTVKGDSDGALAWALEETKKLDA